MSADGYLGLAWRVHGECRCRKGGDDYRLLARIVRRWAVGR